MTLCPRNMRKAEKKSSDSITVKRVTSCLKLRGLYQSVCGFPLQSTSPNSWNLISHASCFLLLRCAACALKCYWRIRWIFLRSVGDCDSINCMWSMILNIHPLGQPSIKVGCDTSLTNVYIYLFLLLNGQRSVRHLQWIYTVFNRRISKEDELLRDGCMHKAWERLEMHTKCWQHLNVN
jgi:hypothetical protein